MKVLVTGTGALGGYYGGLLARAGHQVTFLVRSARIEHLRRDGLHVESAASGNFSVPGVFSDDPRSVGAVDLVLFCVKSFDTAEMAAAIRPCVGSQTAVLSIQNGVENEDTLGEILGPEHILGGAARIEATLTEDGAVKQLSPFHRVDFGEWSGAPDERCHTLLQGLREAGIDAHLAEDARVEVWRKFIFLASIAGLTAATGCTIGQVVALRETRAILERALTEIHQLARAEGVGLPDDIVATTMETVGNIPYHMKSSLQRDLERGRRLEVDALSGAVVRRGRARSVDTPVHETLWACVKARSAAAAQP